MEKYSKVNKAGLAAVVSKYLSFIPYEFILCDNQADSCHQNIVFCSLAIQKKYLSKSTMFQLKKSLFNSRNLLAINKILNYGFRGELKQSSRDM